MDRISGNGQNHLSGVMRGEIAPVVRFPAYTLIKTKSTIVGGIMVGCQPQGIKQMKLDGNEVPRTIVLNPNFVVDGCLMNETEFPLYDNFFKKGRKLRLVGTQGQLNRMRVILSESLFGPRETTDGNAKEREYLRVRDKSGRALILDDFVDFVTLKDDKEAIIDNVRIVQTQLGEFKFFEDNNLLTISYPGNFVPQKEEIGKLLQKLASFLRFAITFFGTSTGFDPAGNTTSFVLWVNGKGIFIDPLSDPIGKAAQLGISMNDIDHVILTHCHADHDAGTLDLIMNSGKRMKFVTSDDVFLSYSRKFAALTGRDIKEFADFVRFNPGDEININGATLRAYSSFHTIPTIGFKAEYLSRKIAYSADTIYNPKLLNELAEKGIISKERCAELLKFVEDGNYDLFIIEAGGPPPHTSEEDLAKLRKEITDKLIIVHTPGIKEGSNLRLAETGQTIELVESKRDIGDSLNSDT
jgi:ribonuclease BN (tRNA processing enzyme)